MLQRSLAMLSLQDKRHMTTFNCPIHIKSQDKSVTILIWYAGGR